MASFRFYNVVTMFCLWVFLISPAVRSQTCKSQKLTGNELYTNCLDLPTLKAYLHYTYNSSNSTLSIAFLSSPPSPSGWVAWAINPTGSGMLGAQALVGYKDSKGVMTVKTYNAKGFTVTEVVQQKLAFDLWDERAEEDNGVTKISAKIKIPEDLKAKGTVNQVWQVGPNVDSKGVLTPHAMKPPNFNSKTTLAFSGNRGVQTTASAGGLDSRTKRKNIHGVLNAVSWGILFPVGIIIARYLRTFQSADPAWFYLHVFCQVSAYAVGVSGWAIGLKLGSESKVIQYTGHRNIGIALFSLATLQIFALFLRPKKDHKYRLYWNVYHHGIGYAILILGILNVFKGLDTLHPEEKWRSAYIIVIAVLGCIALLLEIITWLIVLKKSKKSTKPFDEHNGRARHHP